jgi:hypothetical protein
MSQQASGLSSLPNNVIQRLAVMGVENTESLEFLTDENVAEIKRGLNASDLLTFEQMLGPTPMMTLTDAGSPSASMSRRIEFLQELQDAPATKEIGTPTKRAGKDGPRKIDTRVYVEDMRSMDDGFSSVVMGSKAPAKLKVQPPSGYIVNVMMALVALIITAAAVITLRNNAQEAEATVSEETYVNVTSPT